MYLTQALHRSVQQTPDRIAVSCVGRERTFRVFAGRVARLAGALRTLGMQSGDRIAMLALNSDRYLEYLMAVPWAGGVLNPCNIRWSAAEILYSLEDSDTSILLVDDVFSPLVETIRGKSTSLREVIHCGDGSTPAGMHDYEALLTQADPVPDALRRGEDLAGIFYTGGTTGFPKGVMLSHTNLCSSGLALAAHEQLGPDTVYLHAAPMFHLADFAFSTAAWIAGGSHSIVPAFKPVLVMEAIGRDRVTHTLLVPTMIQILLEEVEANGMHDLASLRTTAYGASPMPDALLERAEAALPHVGFQQAYGMTELAPLATFNPASSYTSEGRRLGRHLSAGLAGYCCEVRIVDVKGCEVPRGTVGEVVVRGPNVMQGYWKQPEFTALAVRDGWMHTGDGGYMDGEGYVFIVDRLKDMIVSGGENIYSAEVENALTQHRAVASCAVIGVPSVEWGETVHAVVVLVPDAPATASELIAHCRTLIAGYKCPSSVEFRAALPLSGAGKVLKTELRKPFWEGRPKAIN